MPSQGRWFEDCQLTKTAELSRWIPEVGQGVLAAVSESGVVYILARIESDPSENTESTISPLKEGIIMAPDGSTTIKRGSSLLAIFEKSVKLVAEKLQIIGDGILMDFKDAKDLAPQWMLTVKNKIMNSSVKVTPDSMKIGISNELSTMSLTQSEVKITTPDSIKIGISNESSTMSLTQSEVKIAAGALGTEAQVKAVIKSSLIKLGQFGASPAVKADAFEMFWAAWMIYFQAHTHGQPPPLPPGPPSPMTGIPIPSGVPPIPSIVRSTQVFID